MNEHYLPDFGPSSTKRQSARRPLFLSALTALIGIGLLPWVVYKAYASITVLPISQIHGTSQQARLQDEMRLLEDSVERGTYNPVAHHAKTKITPNTKPNPILFVNPQAHSLTHHVTIHKDDTLGRIFRQMNLSRIQLRALNKKPLVRETLRRMKPGHQLALTVNRFNILETLQYDINKTDRLVAVRRGEQYRAFIQDVVEPTPNSPEFFSGTLKTSLMQAGHDAGLTYGKTLELAQIFNWEIDFSKLRKGALIEVALQKKPHTGLRSTQREIIAARITDRGKTYTAVLYQNADGHREYFKADGKSLRKAFIRVPVKYRRVSSSFTRRRYHPILHRYRAHRGTDFAAPRGTPVKASADGIVSVIGRHGGYGKEIKLKHNHHYATVYGHLSRFKQGLHKGNHVKRGQVIGYVGSTGLSTGPHLHYEVQIDGERYDPLKVKLPDAAPVPAKARPAFVKKAHALFTQMDQKAHA